MLRQISRNSGRIQARAGDRYAFDFDPVGAGIAKDGDDLVLKFSDGGELAFEGFYRIGRSSFIIDDQEIPAEEFFSMLGAGEIAPAMGPESGDELDNSRFHEQGGIAAMEGLEHLDGLDSGSGDGETGTGGLSALAVRPESPAVEGASSGNVSGGTGDAGSGAEDSGAGTETVPDRDPGHGSGNEGKPTEPDHGSADLPESDPVPDPGDDGNVPDREPDPDAGDGNGDSDSEPEPDAGDGGDDPEPDPGIPLVSISGNDAVKGRDDSASFDIFVDGGGDFVLVEIDGEAFRVPLDGDGHGILEIPVDAGNPYAGEKRIEANVVSVARGGSETAIDGVSATVTVKGNPDNPVITGIEIVGHNAAEADGGTCVFDIVLSNPPDPEWAGATVVQVEIGGSIHEVEIDASGRGVLEAAHGNGEDAWKDASSLSARIVGVSGGNYQKVGWEGKSAEARVADTIDETHVRIEAFDAGNGILSLDISLSNPPDPAFAGDVLAAVDIGGAIHEIRIGADGRGHLDVSLPRGKYGQAIDADISVTGVSGGNLESVSLSDAFARAQVFVPGEFQDRTEASVSGGDIGRISDAEFEIRLSNPPDPDGEPVTAIVDIGGIRQEIGLDSDGRGIARLPEGLISPDMDGKTIVVEIVSVSGGNLGEVILGEGSRIEAGISFPRLEPMDVLAREGGEAAGIPLPEGMEMVSVALQGGHGHAELIDGRWSYVIDGKFDSGENPGGSAADRNVAESADRLSFVVRDGDGNLFRIDANVDIMDDIPEFTGGISLEPDHAYMDSLHVSGTFELAAGADGLAGISASLALSGTESFALPEDVANAFHNLACDPASGKWSGTITQGVRMEIEGIGGNSFRYALDYDGENGDLVQGLRYVLKIRATDSDGDVAESSTGMLAVSQKDPGSLDIRILAHEDGQAASIQIPEGCEIVSAASPGTHGHMEKIAGRWNYVIDRPLDSGPNADGADSEKNVAEGADRVSLVIRDPHGNLHDIEAVVDIVDDIPEFPGGISFEDERGYRDFLRLSGTFELDAGADGLASISARFSPSGTESFGLPDEVASAFHKLTHDPASGKWSGTITQGVRMAVESAGGNLFRYSLEYDGENGDLIQGLRYRLSVRAMDSDGDVAEATSGTVSVSQKAPGDPGIRILAHEGGSPDPIEIPEGYEIISASSSGALGRIEKVDGRWHYVLDKPADSGPNADDLDSERNVVEGADRVALVVRDPLGRLHDVEAIIDMVDDVPEFRNGISLEPTYACSDFLRASGTFGLDAGADGLASISASFSQSGGSFHELALDPESGRWSGTITRGVRMEVESAGGNSFQYTLEYDGENGDLELGDGYALRIRAADSDGDVAMAESGGVDISQKSPALPDIHVIAHEDGRPASIRIPEGYDIVSASTRGGCGRMERIDGRWDYVVDKAPDSGPNADGLQSERNVVEDADRVSLVVRDSLGRLRDVDAHIDIVDDVPEFSGAVSLDSDHGYMDFIRLCGTFELDAGADGLASISARFSPSGTESFGLPAEITSAFHELEHDAESGRWSGTITQGVRMKVESAGGDSFRYVLEYDGENGDLIQGLRYRLSVRATDSDGDVAEAASGTVSVSQKAPVSAAMPDAPEDGAELFAGGTDMIQDPSFDEAVGAAMNEIQFSS